MNCPEFEELIDHLDGRLEASAAETVASHLASGCGQCACDRAWYQGVKSLAADDNSSEPPPWVLKRAFKLFGSSPSRGGLSARLGNIIATLVYDSFAGPVLAGARSTEWVDHQLLYRAYDFNIDLLLESSGEQMKLTGQILRDGESLFESTAGITLDLLREGHQVHSTRTNEFGEFMITTMETGEYDMRIEAGEVSITVAGLAIV